MPNYRALKTMDRLNRPKTVRLLALAAFAIALAVSAPGEARSAAGHGFGGGHFEGGMHHGFEGHHHDGHHDDGHGFDGHHHGHDFDGHHHDGFVFGFGPEFVVPFPYYYSGPPPAYLYYCPDYGAYYPNVTSCPAPWVTVPPA